MQQNMPIAKIIMLTNDEPNEIENEIQNTFTKVIRIVFHLKKDEAQN